MAETSDSLHCAVLTPEGPIFEGNVVSVTAPGSEGHLGILKGHAPIITSLGYGPLRVRLEDDTREEWFVVGGFLEVYRNKVAILARGIERPEDIEVDRVRRELEAGAGDRGPDDMDPGIVARAKIRYAEAWAQAKRGY